jgi:hypothetical protein
VKLTPAVNATMRTHQAALTELKSFDGRTRDEYRGRSWLSSVRAAFRRDQLSPGEACLTFPEFLADRAKIWYKQLDRTVRVSWTTLQAEFEKEYCGAMVTPHQRYYEMRRKKNEETIDYLYRLNVAANEARIFYQEAAGGLHHVQHFINTCEDPELARQLGALRLTTESDLRDVLKELLRQEQRSKRDGNMSNRSTRTDTRSNKHTLPGSRQRPIVVNSLQDQRTTEEMVDYSSGEENPESDEGGEARERDGTDEETEVLTGVSKQTLQTIAALVASLQNKAKSANRTQQQSCSHCGSTRHVDRDCWRRLTCEACGRTGHPTEHCYQRCKGCGNVHERGECPLEEMANQLKSWYDPTKHAGMLPPTLEKMLN